MALAHRGQSPASLTQKGRPFQPGHSLFLVEHRLGRSLLDQEPMVPLPSHLILL